MEFQDILKMSTYLEMSEITGMVSRYCCLSNRLPLLTGREILYRHSDESAVFCASTGGRHLPRLKDQLKRNICHIKLVQPVKKPVLMLPLFF